MHSAGRAELLGAEALDVCREADCQARIRRRQPALTYPLLR